MSNLMPIWSLALLWALPTVLTEAKHEIAALDGDGNAVDWWYVVKLPQTMLDSAGNDIEAHCECPDPECGDIGELDQSEKRGLGLCYLYADSNHPTLTHFQQLGYDCLGQGGRDPVSATLKQMVRNADNWAYWSDQLYGLAKKFDNDRHHRCGAGNRFSAHSKGALCYDDDNGGFFMQVSTPNFPDPSFGNEKFVKLGCQLDNNIKFAQHFFSMSLEADQIEKLGTALQAAKLCSANIYKDMEQLLLSPSLQGTDRSLSKALSARSLPSVDSGKVSIETKINGVQLDAVIKSQKNNVPPWALVAHEINSDLSVATWWDGAGGIPSICHGDEYISAENQFCLVDPGAHMKLTVAGTATHNVENLAKARWKFPDGNTYSWKLLGGVTAGNHGKWGIGTPRNNDESSLVVFGDMNMEGFPCSIHCDGSQGGRGGTFFAMNDSTLWSSMRHDLIIDEDVCSCLPDSGGKSDFVKKRMCLHGCTSRMRTFDEAELPSLNGDSSSFWESPRILPQLPRFAMW